MRANRTRQQLCWFGCCFTHCLEWREPTLRLSVREGAPSSGDYLRAARRKVVARCQVLAQLHFMNQPNSQVLKRRSRLGDGETPQPAGASSALALTMGVTPEMLQPLVEQIADAVAARVQSAPTQPLLDRNELARALGISTATVDRLARAGMPAIRLVDSKRYLLADVLAWLKTREQGA